ncbi:hypothetical protein [Saccharopolyspora cebuensis]|uniref:PH domain-containing protein n=1 Tax=Saccharopolyspora cebuensis TaxID=418759 RepID=A0ABV4CGT5_9PSEU
MTTRPNPQTGEPRPPKAPVFSVWGELERNSAKKARYPAAPEGRGPVLEWYQGTPSGYLLGGVFASIIIFALVCLMDWGFDWMRTWWLWIFVVIPIPMWALMGRQYGISAGADWLAVKKGHVDLYELTEVTVEGASGGLSWTIELTDKKGTEMSVDAAKVQANQQLWDLVYNGIQHSVHHGSAKTNKRALDKLRLRP